MPIFTDQFGPVSADDVTAFEQRCGYTLPADYTMFLTKTNGGVPSPAVCSVDQCGGVLVDLLYGIRGELTHGDLEQEQVRAQELDPLPFGFLVIGHDPGGNSWLLDTSCNGEIYYWDRVGFYPKSNPEGNTYPVASSFAKFLDALHERIE